MRLLILLIWISFTASVFAETVADSTASGSNNEAYRQLLANQATSRLRTGDVWTISYDHKTMPVVRAVGRQSEDLRTGMCLILVSRETGRTGVSLRITSKQKEHFEFNLDHPMAGHNFLDFASPLRRGDLVKYDANSTQPENYDMTYDGSVLRFVKRRYLPEPTLLVFEVEIDSNLKHVGKVRYREFNGETLSSAKSNGTEVICEDLMG